ncbi:MAG: hypothetical protein WBK96_09775 [Candidatus Manganitrophaceae bacterium]
MTRLVSMTRTIGGRVERTSGPQKEGGEIEKGEKIGEPMFEEGSNHGGNMKYSYGIVKCFLRQGTRLMPTSRRKEPPNAQTIEAPVGRSNVTEPAKPSRLAIIPISQPIQSRWVIRSAKRSEASAGTMRKAKTRRTPARETELVTITPKAA